MFNRQLPHAGLVGSENENTIAAVLRDFLPVRFGVEVNAIVIDRFGHASRQADIVIYDAHRQPSFFRKVFPIEIVYGVIEVKTSTGKTEAEVALDNLASVAELEFRPALTPYWQTRTEKEGIHHSPPGAYVFSYRTNCQSFETFAQWFEWDFLNRGVRLIDAAPVYPEIRTLTVSALDQGIIRMESTNGYVQRFIASAMDSGVGRAFTTKLKGETFHVDPAKALFLFMHRLWSDLETHNLHPGFDIRSYMSMILGSVIEVPDRLIYPDPRQ